MAGSATARPFFMHMSVAINSNCVKFRLNTEKRGLKQGNKLVITMVCIVKNSEG